MLFCYFFLFALLFFFFFFFFFSSRRRHTRWPRDWSSDVCSSDLFSKAQLAAGAPSAAMQHIDTSGMVNAPSDAGSTQPGFTVWPAQSPGTDSFKTDNGGTEYFLSSNAADEAQKPVSGDAGTRSSNQLVVWTLTNTASLNAVPALSLSNKVLDVNQYGVPPKQQQPGSGTLATIDTPQ